LEIQLGTITDEVGSGPIQISAPNDLDGNERAEERGAAPPTNEDITPALDRKREKIEISYRPDSPPARASIVDTLDDGRVVPPANDNKPSRYHLKEMAKRDELGINEPENRRLWSVAERLKRDIAISSGESRNDSAAHDWPALMLPYIGPEPESFVTDVGLILNDESELEDSDVPGECAVVDNAEGEYDQNRFLHTREIVMLAEDVLGSDYTVLTSAIVDNWTIRMIGENELCMDRATASGCGKGMLRSALRNLARFYDSLDRLELSGDRPLDVWPLIATQYPTVRYPREYRRRASYMNQTRTHVVRHPASDRAAA
jgi:hypothetical protein